MSQSKSQANQYDKIIKENLEMTLPVIVREVLGNNDGYTIIKEIIEDIKFKTEGEFAESRYFKQLRIFVQLRSNIATQFEKAMEAVSKFFKEERDFLYRRGEARGKAEGEVKKSYDVVENLIVDFGFTDEQAAKAAKVSIDFVQKVRADLAKKKH
ncbi:hypothetical protein M1D52_07155 [Olivibacter sp. SA151]|uniref:hypothetical protein n=1 Tax=Olivibacter jilunii TaxID=985016 RepID=UPI003F16E5CB